MAGSKIYATIIEGGLDIAELAQEAETFRQKLDALKHRLEPRDFGWYPYGSMSNFYLLGKVLGERNPDLLELAGDAPIADIGAADGDNAFFMESLGHKVHAVDYPLTNFNGCRGIRLLKEALGSSVEIHEVNLDAHFDLPGERYGLAFFLGILYHLKNPFGALESLARSAKHAIVSTRVIRYNLAPTARGEGSVNRERVLLDSVPMAYLVGPDETNHDATNYWMFSPAGLRRVLDRAGWDVLEFMTVGNTHSSDPATNDGDERAFCLARSRFLS